MDNFSLNQLRKELYHIKWTITEYPGHLLQFLPTGVLNVFGKDPSVPIKHIYSLIHRGSDFIISTSPHILTTPGEMKVLMMKNHITLQSLKNKEEIIHLTRLKLKSY